ncbi:MAG: PqqD family protein [Acidobacteriota bacterium]
MKQLLPVARSKNLIVKELPDETLIYDLDSDKAHCLNQTAALVWKNCDGRKTVAQLSEQMEGETNSKVPEEMVWLALAQLEESHLLESPLARPARLAGMNRRQLVRTIGIAALTLPVILSIVAPTAAQVGSCAGGNRPDGCPCGNPGDCMPSQHCNSGVCGP